MKGQYLAIESVLTLGMGLAIATGTIGVFNDYKANVLETGEEKQALTVNSRIKSAFNNLKESNKGEITVDLPERIGGSSYQISAGKNLEVRSDDENYVYKLPSSKYSYSGTVKGGTIKLYKRNDKFELRPG